MKHSILKKYSIAAAVLITVTAMICGLTAVVAIKWAPFLIYVAIGLTIVLSVVVGAGLYKGFSNFLNKRIRDINSQLDQAIHGNSLIRIKERQDELSPLETSFNKLMKELTDISSQQVDSRQLVDWAKKEIQLKDQLMEKTRAVEETNQRLIKRLHERDLMLRITESINSTLSLDAVLKEITQSVGNELEMQEFVILLTGPDSGAMNIAAVYGVSDPGRILNLEFKPGEGIVGQVFSSGEPIYVRDVRQEPRFMHYKGRRQVMGSFMAIPIKSRDRVEGVLGFMKAKVDGFMPEEIDFLKILAYQVNIAIQNARSYELVRRQADYDQLTGLMSRRSGMDKLRTEYKESLSGGRQFCMIMLDIDDFKVHNDTYGHMTGDEVLKRVAHFIKVNIRKVDIGCRYGGEEILIGLHRTGLEDGVVVAEKIRTSISAYDFYPDDDKKLGLSVSQGVAAIDKDCKGFAEMVNYADQALLAAKAAGKNVVYAYKGQKNLPGADLK